MRQISCNDPIPTKFICPITKEVMRDPLMTCFGQSYERNAILKWLEYHNNTCPLTRKTLNITDLIRNRTLKYQINTWHKVRCIKVEIDENDVDAENDNSSEMLLIIVANDQYMIKTLNDNQRQTQQSNADSVHRKKGISRFLCRFT